MLKTRRKLYKTNYQGNFENVRVMCGDLTDLVDHFVENQIKNFHSSKFSMVISVRSKVMKIDL